MSHSDYYCLAGVTADEAKAVLLLDYGHLEVEASLYGDIWRCEVVPDCPLERILHGLQPLIGTDVYVSDSEARLYISDGDEKVFFDYPVRSIVWSGVKPSNEDLLLRLRRLYAASLRSLKIAEADRKALNRVREYTAARVPDLLRRLEERIEFHSAQNAGKAIYEEGRRDMLLEVQQLMRSLSSAGE